MSDSDGWIDFPIVMTLQHPELRESQIDAWREALGDATVSDFTLEVVSVGPASTVIRVTPPGPTPYPRLAQAIERVVSGLRRGIFAGRVRLARVLWDGVASGPPEPKRRRGFFRRRRDS